MNLPENRGFISLDFHALDTYARQRAAELALTIPADYVESVLENLAALQTHAAILAARLEGEGISPKEIAVP